LRGLGVQGQGIEGSISSPPPEVEGSKTNGLGIHMEEEEMGLGMEEDPRGALGTLAGPVDAHLPFSTLLYISGGISSRQMGS